MIFRREIEKSIIKNLKPNKAIILIGARRTGKTVIVKSIEKKVKKKTLFLNGEDFNTIELLKERSVSNYSRILSGIELLIIDEAQSIPEIGKIIKLIVDEIKGIKVIATGSSSFDLQNISGDPLTGRSTNFNVFPFSISEIKEHEKVADIYQQINERLIYGSYPELYFIKNNTDKQLYLQNIINSYLLKDIISFDGIKNSSKIFDLLKLIAFQVGNEVSYNELSRNLGISKNTVEKYLDLLSKAFIIFRLGGYSKNLRKEVVKNNKWYFFDTGIRNGIIGNFNEVNLRNDIGELWENFVISEMIKNNSNKLKFENFYFWRTYDQQEIDLIVEKNLDINCFEIKWKETIAKIPKVFSENYKFQNFYIINCKNFTDFLL